MDETNQENEYKTINLVECMMDWTEMNWFACKLAYYL